MSLGTFNFRVGLFGFLASQDVKDDGDLNAGLLDQRKAITWVHNHISAFGGDPERVTLFGTSAGAGGILLHTLAYGEENTSKPLFSAVLSADPFVLEIFPYQRLEFQYQEILNATNCSSLECLRHLPTDSLLAANINRPFPGQTTSPLFYFRPCVDGIFFPDLPSKLLADGRFQRVPLLQGTVTDEGSIFAATANNTDVDQFDEFLSAQFPDLRHGWHRRTILVHSSQYHFAILLQPSIIRLRRRLIYLLWPLFRCRFCIRQPPGLFMAVQCHRPR